MAKYIINQGYGDAKTVEGATQVKQDDGFFYFWDTNNRVVYVRAAGGVMHIERVN